MTNCLWPAYTQNHSAHLSAAIATEPDKVRVNAVNPGQIETDRLAQVLENMGLPEAEARAQLLKRLDMKRFGKPEDISRMVAFLASPHADYVQGAMFNVDGGRTRSW